MGIATPSISVLLMRLSPVAERGFNTSAMQLGDWISSALTIGAGGALLAVLAGGASDPSGAVTTLALALALVAVLGVVLAGRGLRVEGIDGTGPERA